MFFTDCVGSSILAYSLFIFARSIDGIDGVGKIDIISKYGIEVETVGFVCRF